jgi:hypothetical protein
MSHKLTIYFLEINQKVILHIWILQKRRFLMNVGAHQSTSGIVAREPSCKWPYFKRIAITE